MLNKLLLCIDKSLNETPKNVYTVFPHLQQRKCTVVQQPETVDMSKEHSSYIGYSA